MDRLSLHHTDAYRVPFGTNSGTDMLEQLLCFQVQVT